MHRWMRQFHTPSTLLAEQVQSLRKTKNEYFQKMVDEATTQNIWTYWKWTTKMTTYTSPPLDQGENHPPVITHTQKCNTLRTHLFPEPLQLEYEPEPNLNEDPEDLEYHSITKREVKDVVFTAVQLNAPGISGLTGRAWRWAWEILNDTMFNLVNCVQIQDTTPKLGERLSPWHSRNQTGITQSQDHTGSFNSWKSWARLWKEYKLEDSHILQLNTSCSHPPNMAGSAADQPKMP